MFRVGSTFAVQMAGALVLLMAAAAVAQTGTELFPRPAALEPAVRFWTRVYTEVDTDAGFIHDDLRLDIVYQTIDVSSDLSPVSGGGESSAALPLIATF